MENVKAFLHRKDIKISVKRYGIDALGAMAQGLFCSLLIGTIINTLGTQLHIPFLTMTVATVNDTAYTVGGLASAMSGPAMAVAIGYALHCPPLVLFSLITVGFASNALGGAGGPLAVLFVAVLASEAGKAVSKETKVDILVTPLVTIGVGIALSALLAPAAWKGSHESGKCDHVGNRASAIFNGNFSFCICWYRTDTSYFFCCDLCSLRTYRTGRRSSSSRLLCTDGRLCSYVFPGE